MGRGGEEERRRKKLLPLRRGVGVGFDKCK